MGVAASSLPPEPRARHIPPELVEEILLHLPFKSLLRFSKVSKAWHSIIFDARFAKRHKRCCNRAVTIATIPTFTSGEGAVASTRPLSSIHPNQIIGDGDGEPLIFPFEGQVEDYSGSLRPRHLASCGDLWCTEYAYSLFLWNPSIRTFRKLPRPSDLRPYLAFFDWEFCAGVGYDSVGDDYKILKFNFREYNAEVYSLRSDTWKQAEPFPGKILGHYKGLGGLAVSGALHWLARAPSDENERVIISFDLSAEKYAEVPMLRHNYYYGAVLSLLRGKLCVVLDYGVSQGRIGMYVMQEYGVAESWAKVFEFEYSPNTPYLSDYESGLIGLTGLTADQAPKTLICADEESMEQRIFRCHAGYDCHLYVESLTSPETYCGPRQTTVCGRNQPRKRDNFLAVLSILSLCISYVIGISLAIENYWSESQTKFLLFVMLLGFVSHVVLIGFDM